MRLPAPQLEATYGPSNRRPDPRELDDLGVSNWMLRFVREHPEIPDAEARLSPGDLLRKDGREGFDYGLKMRQDALRVLALNGGTPCAVRSARSCPTRVTNAPWQDFSCITSVPTRGAGETCCKENISAGVAPY